MSKRHPLVRVSRACAAFIAVGVLLCGCQMFKNKSDTTHSGASGTTTKTAMMKPAARPAIRINAGATTQSTDSAGNVWLPDTGFTGGSTVERAADMAIEGTKDPAIYRSEHYSMTAFSQPVPNGKYTVKLHFAETSSAVTGPGGRVFSVNVEGHDIKNLDVWSKAGGGKRAYVETVPAVEVTDGKLDITFTEGTQHTEINGIEIIPAM